MDKPVIIFGAGELGRLALEIFQSNGQVVYGFLDDDSARHGSELGEVPILGSSDDQGFLKLIGKKCEACVAVEDPSLRQGLVKMVVENRKMMPVNAIHQQAYISNSSSMGHGNIIGPGAILNANSFLGSHTIIHSNALIDYSAKVQDYVQLGAGSIIGAEAEISAHAFVGTGAVVVPGIQVAKGGRIGAGSVVVANVSKGETVFGNPASKVDNG